MKYLNADDCLAIAYGGTIFGTGGGLPLQIQKAIFSELIERKIQMGLINFNSLKPDNSICCVHGIGPAGSFSSDFATAVSHGIKILSDITQMNFSAVFPVETSIESAVFASLALSGLPLLDADVTGGRAVPEISMDNFFIMGESVTPAVMVNLDRETLILNEPISAYQLEKEARRFANESREGLVALIDHPIRCSEAKKLLSLETTSRTMKAGRIILENISSNEKISKLESEFGCFKISEGIVTDNQLERKEGFLQGTYTISNPDINIPKTIVHVKNENMYAISEKAKFVFPALLILFDLENGIGIHNSTLMDNQRVALLCLKEDLIWDGFKYEVT